MNQSVNVGRCTSIARHCRGAVKLQPLRCVGRRRVGTVVVVDSNGANSLDARPRHKSLDAPSRPSAAHQMLAPNRNIVGTVMPSAQEQPAVASRQYQIPAPYLDLVRGRRGKEDPQSDIAGKDDSSPLMEDNGDSKRELWKAARLVARKRLEPFAGPDSSACQRHMAKLHESLWIEEVGVTLELQRWRLAVDSVPPIGDGLYTLDVTEVSDQLAAAMDDKGILRGVRLVIRCSRGRIYNAALQPGSNSGTLILSAASGLSNAEGPFDVEFHPQRFQQLAMHRALDTPQVESIVRGTMLDAQGSSEPAISPTTPPTDSESSTQSLPASLNECQRRAVYAALESGKRYPLVIWGPPGTGKSTLAAFIIWHMVQQRPTDLHILVAAPSNTGADVLCAKLAQLGLDERQLMRLNAVGRSPATVPTSIERFCFLGEPGDDGRRSFAVPPLPQVRRFKVVVTTCVCAAHLSNALRAAGGATGWFSHVIVDEAGEATEPETLVPLGLLRPVAGQVVLLGDHFQLGPLVLTMLAAQIGNLDASMIQRLANERFNVVRMNEGSEGFNRDTLVECENRGLFFLTESYRSHPAIMSLYSKIFYADQLEHTKRQQHSRLQTFFSARDLSSPVIFHNVVGTERRDDGGTSFYNPEEVRIVQQYLVDIFGDESAGIVAKDVGIITPYARQVRAIERQLDSLGSDFTGIDCGTVEKFQGQERTVIIMSTVRCLKLDALNTNAIARKPIGFLADPRRLNVAISRAVAGLIIVGDLRTLAQHSSQWRALVELGVQMGSIRGEPLASLTTNTGADRGRIVPETVTKSSAVPVADSSAAWDALTGT